MPQFLDYIRTQAKQLRADDQTPKSLDEWNRQRQQLRRQLIKSWGHLDTEGQHYVATQTLALPAARLSADESLRHAFFNQQVPS